MSRTFCPDQAARGAIDQLLLEAGSQLRRQQKDLEELQELVQGRQHEDMVAHAADAVDPTGQLRMDLMQYSFYLSELGEES